MPLLTSIGVAPPPALGVALPRALLAAPLALIFIVFALYRPVLAYRFIWDDDAHLTPPMLQSWDGLARIWTEPGATQQYYPVLHSLFWLEHRAWGRAPAGYHTVNLALHASAAVLFYLLLRQLAIRGALLAALFFALHPVNVESVAWISEQKNTLSTAFYLLAASVYLRFHARRSIPAYCAAFGLFALALLAKSVTATLPAALLVVLWWRRGTLSWRHEVAPLVPWLVLGLAAGLHTAWVERTIIGAEGASFALSPVQRWLLAGQVPWFYLGKLLWPLDLAFIYPRASLDPAHAAQWFPLLAAAALLVLLFRIRHRSRAPLAAALLFGGTLFPVLGFLNVYPFQYSFVADHFQYLAALPVFALAASAFASTVASIHLPRLGIATACALLAAWFALARDHVRDFADNPTLFRATLAQNPGAWMAHNNLGRELMTDKARLPEAIACFERALALRPAYPEALNNLGLALSQAGRPAAGIPYLEASLRLKPNSFQTHNNHGIALATCGRLTEALDAFARAAALNPTLPNIHENWAKTHLLLNRPAEAQARLSHAHRLRGQPE